MRADYCWGVTIGLCFLQSVITAVFTCCGDNGAQSSSAYKVVRKVCAQGWKSVDTSSPGSLREGSPFLTQSWGQQTLCLKVYHSPATWREASDSCRLQHGTLVDLDFPGFVSQNLVTVIQNLAREIWGEGLERLWTGMFIKADKLWWDHPAPRPVYGPDHGAWWEWLAGQPKQRSGSYGRLDLKNGTSTGATPPDSDGSILVPHPTSVFRLGMSLAPGTIELPYACINNGFELPPTQGRKCPPGWYGSPYIDKCLWHSNKHLATYTEARALCKEKGAELAMPKDIFYNAYVTKVILNMELGLPGADDPDVESINSEQTQGHSHGEAGMETSASPQCVICNNALSIDKCQPALELNGSCPPDKSCGLRVIKMANGTILYAGGCYRLSECIFGDRINPQTLEENICTVQESTYTICCSTYRCFEQVILLMTDFTCAPKFPSLVEGSSNVAPESSELECFTCDGVSSDEECISRGSIVRCDREYPTMKSPVCLTQVWQESRHSRVKITKYCSRATDCEGAHQDCTPLSVSPRCVYCCRGNRCNQWLPDNPIDRPSTVRKTWIGFQKKASLLNWEDGQVSKVSAWNKTFGSVYPYLPESGCGQLWADRPWGNEWLVGDCSGLLPYVCEMKSLSSDDDGVKILVHPKDVNLHLQYPEEEPDTYKITSQEETISLSCEAINYHPDFPVVWVKDGRYFDNGIPPGGFNLDVTMEKLSDIGGHGGLVHGLQGDYHCEVWDMHGNNRVRSNSAIVKFEDVITFQGTIRIPNHSYNSTLHSSATLLFSPTYRIGLEYYQQMVYSLTMFNTSRLEFPHEVIIKSYRHGSLVIDFTLFYELLSSDIKDVLNVQNFYNNQDSRLFLEQYFRSAVEESIVERLTDNSTHWFRQFAALGIRPADVTLRGTSSCPEHVTNWQGRILRWPSTAIGTNGKTQHVCLTEGERRPFGTRPCLGDFHTGAYWGEPIYIESCPEKMSAATMQLRELSEVEVTNKNINWVVERLTYLTAEPPSLISTDLVYISYTLENLAKVQNISIEVARAVIDLASDIVLLNNTVIEEAQDLDYASNRIRLSLEQIGKVADIQKKSSTTLFGKNLIMAIYDVGNQSAVVQGFGYHGDLNSFVPDGVRQFDPHQENVLQTLTLGIALPKRLLEVLTVNNDDAGTSEVRSRDGIKRPVNKGKKNRVVFTLYRTTELFKPRHPKSLFKNHLSCGTAVAATVQEISNTDMDEPVLTMFRFKEEIVPSDVRCVFWNYSALEEGGDWSDVGCYVNQTVGKSVICACHHLTTFSVLLDTDKSNRLHDPDEVTLSLTLIVGLCFSIAGLGLTVITFIIFRKLRRSSSQKILFNIAVSVLLANTVMWIGIDGVTSGAYCIAMAALLHFFLMAAFTWMLVESILGFLLAIRGSAVSKNHFILKASVPAWGFPAVVVGVVCGVDYKLYQSTNDYCWLTGIPLHVGFVLPCSLILVVIIVLSCCVLCRLAPCQAKFSPTTPHEVNSSVSPGHFVSNMLGALLLGVTWTTAYFSLEYEHKVLEFIFSVTNGLFGLYIFVIFLIREPSFRESCWPGCWECCPCSRRKSESSPASSVGTISSKLAPSLQKTPEPPGESNIYIVYPSEITSLPS